MTETTQSALPKRFGDFEFDSRARQLRKHGHTIRLHGQPLEILGLLLERPAQVVLREEFRARLWPEDTFVDFEHSLNAAVNKLREALDDNANNPRFIETVPRRGYRFISAVDLQDSLDLKLAVPEMAASLQSSVATVESRIPSRHLHRGVFVTALVLVVVVAVVFGFDLGRVRRRLLAEPSVSRIRSIAVLPLENLSKDTEQEYFADGMTDALITNLAKLGSLRITSRTSVMRYKQTKRTIKDIGRELDVDAVIEGTVMAFGDSLTEGATILSNDPYDIVHPPATAYPTVLGQLLSARYTDQTITVFNRGLVGEQAWRALSRFIAAFVADAPDVVVLQEGYNDFRVADSAVTGIANAGVGITELAGEARRRGARVFICTLAPGRPGRAQIPTSALEVINDRLRSIARSEGAVLVDLYSALLPDVNGNVSIDGLHLTPLGYRRVAETVFAAIRADLETR